MSSNFFSKLLLLLHLLLCDTMHKHGQCRRVVSLSVRLPITFAYSVEMSKHIFNIFGPLGSHTIVVYFIPNVMAILRRGPSLTGASNAGGVGKNCDSRPLSDFGIDDWWSVINSFDHEVKCITADADDDRQASVNLVYDSKGCIVTD